MKSLVRSFLLPGFVYSKPFCHSNFFIAEWAGPLLLGEPFGNTSSVENVCTWELGNVLTTLFGISEHEKAQCYSATESSCPRVDI